MLSNIVVLCLLSTVAIAAPYPSENAFNAAETQETFPKSGGLKLPVRSHTLQLWKNTHSCH